MKKSLLLKILLPILAIAIAGGGIFLIIRGGSELRNVRSDEELYSFYEHDTYTDFSDSPLISFITLPFSLFKGRSYSPCYDCDIIDYEMYDNVKGTTSEGITDGPQSSSSNSKDFSTTNIQVENVDEADIVKTDGDYTYSISGDDVVITDVRDTKNPKIAAQIESTDESIPEDIILADDTLTIIGTEVSNSGRFYSSYSRYYNNNNTTVRVYDIKDRTNPRLEKNYKLHQPYYTSRRIGSKLYVISSGHLRQKSGSDRLVDRTYTEDFVEKEFPVSSVRYLKDVRTDSLTLVSVFDLNNLNSEITLEPFLLDISNAYVSENAFYLLDEGYASSGSITFWDEVKYLFGPGGIIGYISKELSDSYRNYDYQTTIYKFNIESSGTISYAAKSEATGTTINQYSLDEKDSHLRLALHDDDGSYVAIFDEKLNLLGKSGHLAKNERMYASRFMGDKAYLVTYKNTDPLFVIDLADERNPKVLGELKIPGYSTYLHPYDETHLIGIGVDTEEATRKDVNGRVISSFAYITGMKVALFDVSDFKNPKQISSLHIGDSSTSSAILSNPKALLFSKEKELLAIPVNNYQSEFRIEIDEDEIDSISTLDTYLLDYDDYVDEGYLIYKITAEGIEERGEIVHKDSDLIRGLYIDDDLLTISENTLKINQLSDLSLKSELNLVKE
ncbi:beta-propeller domain-containing protein [Candidatus Saccharibacteria bacterium]|nr:beta-propeller domain-containing protein [Candidatus Saccharibacteria bacterium]